MDSIANNIACEIAKNRKEINTIEAAIKSLQDQGKTPTGHLCIDLQNKKDKENDLFLKFEAPNRREYCCMFVHSVSLSSEPRSS